MSEPPRARRTIRFGVFELDFGAAELRKRGRRVKLEAQPFQLLCALMRRPGELVPREELREALWASDTFIEFDHSLNTAVKKIRQALDDSPRNPRYIETVPRQGYRFIGAVESPVEGDRPQHQTSHRVPTRRWNPVLVVVIVVAGLAAATAWYLRPAVTAPGVHLAPVPLTTYQGVEGNPSFSPEGDRVTFTWNGPEQDNFDIYVKLVGSETAQQLTTHPARDGSPVWSPDGRQIAFLRELAAGKAAVLLIPAIGGAERKLAESYNEIHERWRNLAWSPDGSWLVISDQDSPEEPIALFALSVDTGDKHRLTNPRQGLRDKGPSISPDGSTLAFHRRIGNRAELFRLELSEDLSPQGQPGQLTFENSFSVNPVWTPDGRELIFSSGEFVSPGLWRIPASGSAKPERLTFAGAPVTTPTISRQGNRLAYSQASPNSDVWRVEVATPGGRASQPMQLIHSTRLDYSVEYSPDGRRIAFQSLRSGTPEIWVCDSDGADPVRLTSLGADSWDPRWSPDGEWISFSSDLEGNREIYVVNAQGGSPKRMTDDPAADNDPWYSRDGKWINFSSKRGGERQLWRVPNAGGEAVQVTESIGRRTRESPDGRYLFYAKVETGSTSVWRVPTAGGKETQVLDSLRNLVLFTVVDEGMYFIPEPDAEMRYYIRFLDFTTGTTRTVAALDGEPGWGLAVSPDGRSILYAQYAPRESDLMLVESFR